MWVVARFNAPGPSGTRVTDSALLRWGVPGRVPEQSACPSDILLGHLQSVRPRCVYERVMYVPVCARARVCEYKCARVQCIVCVFCTHLTSPQGPGCPQSCPAHTAGLLPGTTHLSAGPSWWPTCTRKGGRQGRDHRVQLRLAAQGRDAGGAAWGEGTEDALSHVRLPNPRPLA